MMGLIPISSRLRQHANLVSSLRLVLPRENIPSTDVRQHNWDNIGLRLTESGSVKIDHVEVPWADALGWDPEAKKPREAILDIPWATLLLPT